MMSQRVKRGWPKTIETEVTPLQSITYMISYNLYLFMSNYFTLTRFIYYIKIICTSFEIVCKPLTNDIMSLRVLLKLIFNHLWCDIVLYI